MFARESTPVIGKEKKTKQNSWVEQKKRIHSDEKRK